MSVIFLTELTEGSAARSIQSISQPVSPLVSQSVRSFNQSVYLECVRLTSSNSQIQNRKATKGFVLIRHKRYQIYTWLQLSSSVASFVWKPAHFELRSYGGA